MMTKTKFLCFIICCCFFSTLAAQKSHYAKITYPTPPKGSELIRTGTSVNPKGTTIGINSQSLLVNNKPVIPVMGEIHYARVNENEWRQELLKMKAGGINVASSYVFWIHHEEIKRQYNWTEQRNIRKFLEICKEVNMPFVLRIGPWCHGEVRNGGFPDWLIDENDKNKLRSNEEEYLAEVRTWYGQLYKQAEGLLWKDGGPVVAIQLENEYGGTWEHLMALKNIAIEAGFDVPLYNRTGWPLLKTPATFGEMVPLYGGYAEGFWNREPVDMPGNDYKSYFIFRSFRNGVGIATEQLPPQAATDNPNDVDYPMFACETGGGMVPSYHRRVNIAPMDNYAVSLVQIGSGCNLPGYYMYHGGINPDGKLTYLNEVQNSSYTFWNDLPAKSYEWHAPLGAFGQVNAHYHILRRMHLFLSDFGNELALMPAFFPDSINQPQDANNTSSLRWNVRSDGHSGYVFVSNYQRLQNMPLKSNVSFTLDLPNEKLVFPSKPITVAANSSFFVPFNLNLNGVKLKYSTTQPIAKIQQGKELTVFFSKIEGIPTDFVFDAQNVTITANVNYRKQGNEIFLENVKSGTDVAIKLKTKDNAVTNIVLLDEKTSLNLWKGQLDGKERVFLSNSELIVQADQIELTDTNKNVAVSVYPAPKSLYNGATPLTGKSDGIFTRYELELPKIPLPEVKLSKVKNEGPLRKINKGIAKVAELPDDKDFEQAAVWKIDLTRWADKERNLFLRLPYKGDVARIYAGKKLLTDDFYNGNPLEIGLKRFYSDLQENELTIQILPLQKDVPIHISKAYLPEYNNVGYALSLPESEIYEKYSLTLTTDKKTYDAKLPRFVVISDTHIGNNESEAAVKTPRALKNLFSKKPLPDAIFIVGDMTHRGKVEQYEQLLSIFNDTSNVPKGVEVFYIMGYQHDKSENNDQKNFLDVLKKPLHQLVEIKGYPFVYISEGSRRETPYNLEARRFLEENMAKAAAQYPGKPIFVFMHIPPLNTCYGSTESDGWGTDFFMPVLSKYPQAIVFSGHSHFPLSDPRSIHQGIFTSVNDGSSIGCEIEENLLTDGYKPKGSENVTEGIIVNVLPNGNVEMERWNTYQNEEILPRWTVEAPHDGSRFAYKNRNGLPAPIFAKDAKVNIATISTADSSCVVTFPQATDNEVVHHYLIEILDGDKIVASNRTFSQFYLNSQMPKSLSVKMAGLPLNRKLTARVTALDSYKNPSVSVKSKSFQVK